MLKFMKNFELNQQVKAQRFRGASKRFSKLLME